MCPRRGIPLPLKGPGIACIYPYRPHFKPPLQHSALWLPHSLFGANFRHTMPATPTRHLQIYMIEESSSKTKECKKRNYTYVYAREEREREAGKAISLHLTFLSLPLKPMLTPSSAFSVSVICVSSTLSLYLNFFIY